jgi:hypothetical protein
MLLQMVEMPHHVAESVLKGGFVAPFRKIATRRRFDNLSLGSDEPLQGLAHAMHGADQVADLVTARGRYREIEIALADLIGYFRHLLDRPGKAAGPQYSGLSASQAAIAPERR